MEKIGLIDDIQESVINIYQGRQWLDTAGKERAGRISFNDGLSLAMKSFQDVITLVSDDLEMVLLCEYTFLGQELEICGSTDNQAVSSLTSAIQDMDDAFESLKAVNDAQLYKGADMTHPHSIKHRYKGMPKDAFHIMCIAYRARVQNILRTPGINLKEKELFAQRLANINTAQAAYHEKQKSIMEEIEKQ